MDDFIHKTVQPDERAHAGDASGAGQQIFSAIFP
jgi:hypothetical protein